MELEPGWFINNINSQGYQKMATVAVSQKLQCNVMQLKVQWDIGN